VRRRSSAAPRCATRPRAGARAAAPAKFALPVVSPSASARAASDRRQPIVRASAGFSRSDGAASSDPRQRREQRGVMLQCRVACRSGSNHSAATSPRTFSARAAYRRSGRSFPERGYIRFGGSRAGRVRRIYRVASVPDPAARDVPRAPAACRRRRTARFGDATLGRRPLFET